MKMTALVLASIIAASPLISEACLQTPAPSGVVTSLYGWRFHPVLKMWRLHRGVDLRADMMTPLIATQDGVTQVSFSPSGGNELRIIGADGTVSRYLHLTRVTVEPGTRVNAGQQVALSGNTGHASAAPHLHFEVYPKSANGDVNPEPLLCPAPSRKSGADQVNGFPIMACKPEEGGSCNPSTGGGGVLGPVAGGSSGNSSGSAAATSPGPKLDQFDDMSTNEIYTSEVMKRFGNPDWYARLQERTSVPLVAEYVHMLALGAALELEKYNARARITEILATRLARTNKKEMDVRLDRQRETTAKAQ